MDNLKLRDVRTVQVTWVDSNQPKAGWELLSEITEFVKPPIVTTIGYLVHDERAFKSIAMNVGLTDDGTEIEQILGVVTIPSCCILEISDFRIPRPRRVR